MAGGERLGAAEGAGRRACADGGRRWRMEQCTSDNGGERARAASG
jgi:hypothetical protein